MNIQLSRTTIVLIGMCIAILMGGCATQQRKATEESSRQFGGAEHGERVTRAELNELTRGFADRYVGLLYSVCDALRTDNPDPAQRRAAQMLLVDNATNVYDIASNADPFTRVLDLVVVTTLVSQQWDEDGRAEAVFGERGQALADALSQARAEAQQLAARVLSAEQLDILHSLLLDWREENPKVVRASFVRFSNFAIGRGKSAADQILEARGLFSEIGKAGQSVDEARLLAERTFYRLKRESTLLQWKAAAVKADLVATPEFNTALADMHSVTDQIEQLPANIAAERQAILAGIDDRLQDADATIANVKATIDGANTLVTSLKQAAEPLNEMLTTADTLYARHAASASSKTGKEGQAFDIREYEQMANSVTLAAEEMNELLTTADALYARHAASAPSKTGKEGQPFDIREYEQMAKNVTLAVEGMNELLTTADTLYTRHAASAPSKTGKEGQAFDIREYEQMAKNVTLAVEEMNELLTGVENLIGSPDFEHGMQEVNDSVDERIMTLANQSKVVMNAFFWYACALLGVLFVMLILYQVISLLIKRKLGKEQAA